MGQSIGIGGQKIQNQVGPITHLPLATPVASEVYEDPSAANQHGVRRSLRLRAFPMQATISECDDDSHDTLSSESIGIPIYAVEDTPLETSSVPLYCALIGCRLYEVQGQSGCLHQGLLLILSMYQLEP